MSRPLPPGQPYAGRRENAGVIVLTLDREALEVLNTYATKRTQGQFIARLLYEHHARQEEKQRLAAMVAES